MESRVKVSTVDSTTGEILDETFGQNSITLIAGQLIKKKLNPSLPDEAFPLLPKVVLDNYNRYEILLFSIGGKYPEATNPTSLEAFFPLQKQGDVFESSEYFQMSPSEFGLKREEDGDVINYYLDKTVCTTNIINGIPTEYIPLVSYNKFSEIFFPNGELNVIFDITSKLNASGMGSGDGSLYLSSSNEDDLETIGILEDLFKEVHVYKRLESSSKITTTSMLNAEFNYGMKIADIDVYKKNIQDSYSATNTEVSPDGSIVMKEAGIYFVCRADETPTPTTNYMGIAIDNTMPKILAGHRTQNASINSTSGLLVDWRHIIS